MTLYRWFFVLASMLAFSGCVYPPSQPTPPPPAPAAPVAPPKASAETLAALEQLTDLKEELKKLRNAVEEILFDIESTTRRQHNLFQDMDRRLLSLERAQRLLSLPPATYVDGNVGALSGVTPGAVEGGATNGIVGATADVALVAGGTAAIEPAVPADSDTEAQLETVSVQEQEVYNRAFDLLKKSKYQEAIDQFQQMADTWPDSQLADDAYYWMSEALYVNREFEAALRGFRTVLDRYPKSQRVPDALLKIGYIRYDIGAYKKAAEVFRDILVRFPGHQVAVSAQTRLRRIEQTIQ